jgi:N-methylhydantoinase B/oxoprolinase/acetone carboxylase alpha subunit
MYDQYALVTDTDGAGKYRGTLSVARDWRYMGKNDAVFQLRTDRQKVSPYGLYGGEPGAISESILNPDTESLRLRKQTITLKKGDVYRLLTQGGGGWGDPLERDVVKVQGDVRNDRISLRRAREVYGVVMDAKTLEVDLEETNRLREVIKKRKSDPLERDVEKVQGDVRNDRISLRRAREVYGVVMGAKTLEVDLEETLKIRNALREQRGVPATTLTVAPPFGSNA